MADYIYTILVILGGFALILLDIMIIPGGLVGTLGGILIIATIYNGYRLIGAGFAINVSIFTTLAASLLIYTTLKFKLWRFMSHKETASGISPFSESMLGFVGKSGEAITPLRPSGKIKIEGVKHDAVSNGNMIDSGMKVEVIGVSGGQLVVKLVV